MIVIAKKSISVLAIIAAFLVGSINAAWAAKITIVAFGASHTYSKGVSRSSAYPAQLAKILRARGVNARVINAGRNGNTTGQMLARLNASVPKATHVVILQPGGNDRRKGVSKTRRKANIRAIKQRLKSRGVKVIMMRNRVFGQMRKVPGYKGRDGQHLTAAGYRALAQKFVGKVMGALGK